MQHVATSQEGIEERLSCMDTESNTSCLQSVKRAVANNWKWWRKQLSIILASPLHQLLLSRLQNYYLIPKYLCLRLT